MLTTMLAAAMMLSPTSASLQTPPATTAAEKAASYVRRVTAEDGTITVQTCARKFTAAGKPDIWLVGVVHIGLADYYKSIQETLDAQDVVFYEGVRPSEKQKAEAEAKAKEHASGGEAQESSKHLYVVFGEALQLEFQNAHLSYKDPKFINVDLSWDEMDALNKKQQESGKGGGQYAMVQQVMDPNSPMAKTMITLLQSPIPGFKDALKVFFVKQLGEENKMTQDAGFSEIILNARNKVVEDKLAETFKQSQQPKSIGVIYGALHQPLFEKHLVDTYKYVPGETKWFAAANANPEKLDANGKRMLQMLESSTGAPGIGG